MAHDRYSKDLEAIKARGVQVIKTPDSVLDAQLAAWTKVVDAQQGPVLPEGAHLAEGVGEAHRPILPR